MTNEQAKKMLKAKLDCLKRETSGTDFDCNDSNCDECPLCYGQGNEYWNLRGFTDRKNYWLRNVVSASLFAYGVHQQSEAEVVDISNEWQGRS